MLRTAIGFDAFNISMPKGTGIATYGRNLNKTVRGLGRATGLLYGPEVLAARKTGLAEVSLFDAPAPPRRRLLGPVHQGLNIFVSLPGRTASLVESYGDVITDHIARHAPPVDQLWACQDVFHTANRAFIATERMTRLSFAGGSHAGPAIMHWTCPLPLHAPGRPNLYTIHDMVPLRLPFATLDNKRKFLRMCQQIARRADQIVTVSECSKRDLVRMLNIDERRITVTYQSVEAPHAVMATLESDLAVQIEEGLGLAWKGYFLFFGAIEPKKNLARLVESYLASGVKAPLVIVGGKAWLEEQELGLMTSRTTGGSKSADGARRAKRIRHIDFLPYSLLSRLIRGARGVLAPFLYEGFGLPVLEAMIMGTPVLASTTGALPEVAGDAALLVNPYDVDAVRQAIRRLDADADLRADLSARGPIQAEKFSEEAYAERLAALYKPFS
jgi:glycosyltransferase involved in cell wall biosynthesis